MIDGIMIEELKQIVDHRGRVMHMLRIDDSLFNKFGEIYFSEILPSVVKAWKRHKRMTQFITVPIGIIKLVLYDDRQNSKSKGSLDVLTIGRENYRLIKIPPNIWYGFQCKSEHPALIVNCTDLPHDPDEAENKEPADSDIPYRW